MRSAVGNGWTSLTRWPEGGRARLASWGRRGGRGQERADLAGRTGPFRFGRLSRLSPSTFESDFSTIFPRDKLCCLSRALPNGKPQNNKYELWLTYCVSGALPEISRGRHDNPAKIFVAIGGIREPRLRDMKRHSPGHTAREWQSRNQTQNCASSEQRGEVLPAHTVAESAFDARDRDV